MSARSTRLGRELAAHHEAAHAVVAAGYGFHVEHVEIGDNPHTTWKSDGGDGETVRRRVRVALAGPAMGNHRNEPAGAGSDAASALSMIFAFRGPDRPEQSVGVMLEEAYAVGRLLKRPEIKAAVAHLAAALLERGALTGAELDPYLSPIKGVLPEIGNEMFSLEK